MDYIISDSKKAASIFVNWGAYARFFAAEENQLMYTGRCEYEIVGADDAQTAFTVPDAELWFRFKELYRAWRAERGATSSITKAALCPAYQSIIGMGKDVVPLIFAQLRSEANDPDQWFWALKAILGVDPVKDEDRGNYARMAESWLEWAKKHGYAR